MNVLLGTALRLGAIVSLGTVVGCATWGTRPATDVGGSPGLASALVRIDNAPAPAGRQIQTVATDAATFSITAKVAATGTLRGSASGALSGTTLASITNLPSDTSLNFKVTLSKSDNTTESGVGWATATLVSQAGLNTVNVTVYTNGGDLSGSLLNGSVAPNGVSGNVVSSRFKLLGGAWYRVTPSATCSTGVTHDTGTEAADPVAPGTGTAKSDTYEVSIGSTGWYDIKSTFAGCTATAASNSILTVLAERVATASVVVN